MTTPPVTFDQSEVTIDNSGVTFDGTQPPPVPPTGVTFDNTLVSFDNTGFTFDGKTPAPLAGNMPYLIGQELWDAIEILQAKGIFVPGKIGYFGTFPIFVKWQQSAAEGGTVLSQIPAYGASI